MRLLLDTNVLLWWQWRDRRLSTALRDSIEDIENDVTVSAITIWEICIKRNIGKLEFTPEARRSPVRRQDFVCLM